MENKIPRPVIITIPIMILLLIFMLMVNPIIGVADNGDFQRIMGSTGLQHLTPDHKDLYFGYISRLYQVNDIPLQFAGYYASSEVFIIKLAILLQRYISDNGLFDIRYLSLLYSVIFILSVYLIIKYNLQKKPLTNWFMAFILMIIFADVGYISYFNSLYGEAVSFSFLFLTLGIALFLVKQEKPRMSVLVCFFLSSLMFISAKVQNLPIALALILFSLRLYQLWEGKLWRRVILTFSFIIIVSSVAIYFSTPQGIKNCNKYQSVFYGILKDSPTPEKDLEELGIDKKYAVLAGTNFFMKGLPFDLNSPKLQTELYDKIERKKIFQFYFKHPMRYIEKLEKTANSGFQIRQQGFGNYEKLDNIHFGQMTKYFSFWSNIKMRVIPNTLIFVVLFYLVYMTLLIKLHLKASHIRQKIYLEIFMLVGLIGLIQFLIPILGDGEADLSKHLFLFNVCFDLMIAASLTWAFNQLLSMKERFKKPVFAKDYLQ